MGRQTAVVLSEEDENGFLTFLREDADVRIYRWSAPSPELLIVPEFPPRGPGEWHYRLWNAAFPWEPEYGQRRVGPGLSLEFYLINTAGSPLIEYTRHAFDQPKPAMYGRIYWNTDCAIYKGADYDRAAFGRWYDHVVRWLRKNGIKAEVSKHWFQYWLPGAWSKRGLNRQ